MKWISCVALMLVILAGCRSIQYVPIDTLKTDSIFFNLTTRDSIYIHDSVFIKEKNDTIYQYRYKYIYKDVLVHDTTYIERTDTIQVPIPVERKLSNWEQLKIRIVHWTTILVVFVLLVAFGKCAYRLLKS